MIDILVIGGAGYIGSIMCKHLKKNGYQPIVLDNLTTGHRQSVKWGPLYEGSLDDTTLLNRIFTEHQPKAVMHFAACCYVNESVKEPCKYYRNNVAATITLLEAMVNNNISNFIFSSSCATYGEPVEIPITEDHPQHPINPYGRTKLMIEQILADMSAANNLQYISLRYFNAAGADPEGELGEDHNPEPHLIPLILNTALGQQKTISIFGDDYPTKDGTCIRDYIHVNDIAQAHLFALEKLLNGKSSGVYNLGNGGGHSVKEVIDVARKVTGRPIPIEIFDRRAGDPGILISTSDKAYKELKWQPKYTNLHDIIGTAWHWLQTHPDGFKDDVTNLK